MNTEEADAGGSAHEAEDAEMSDLTPVQSEAEAPAKKKRKPRAPKPEPIYIIPDVEKKTTTFKGRLGA